jgi:hypothetical protein
LALDSIIRKLVGVAHKLTTPLQATVVHEPWIGTEETPAGKKTGKPVYGTAVARLALVEYTDALSRRTTGEEVKSRAKVTFLVPIEANGADNRQEPIDPRDRITLPDGTSGPILSINGLVDPSTEEPYLYEVSLGG